MRKKYVYLVQGATGSYEDYREFVIGIFSLRSEAEEVAKKVYDEAKDFKAKFELYEEKGYDLLTEEEKIYYEENFDRYYFFYEEMHKPVIKKIEVDRKYNVEEIYM